MTTPADETPDIAPQPPSRPSRNRISLGALMVAIAWAAVSLGVARALMLLLLVTGTVAFVGTCMPVGCLAIGVRSTIVSGSSPLAIPIVIGLGAALLTMISIARRLWPHKDRPS